MTVAKQELVYVRQEVADVDQESVAPVAAMRVHSDAQGEPEEHLIAESSRSPPPPGYAFRAERGGGR